MEKNCKQIITKRGKLDNKHFKTSSEVTSAGYDRKPQSLFPQRHWLNDSIWPKEPLMRVRKSVKKSSSKSRTAILKQIRKPFYIDHNSPSPKPVQLAAFPQGEEEKSGMCPMFWLLGSCLWDWYLSCLTLTTDGNQHAFNAWGLWRAKESSAAFCSTRELAELQMEVGWGQCD